MNKNVLDLIKNFLVWFSIFYLMFWGYSVWQDRNEAKEVAKTGVLVEWVDSTPVSGQLVQARVENYSEQALNWTSPCTADSLKVERAVSGQRLALDIPSCQSQAATTIAPGTKVLLSFPSINHELWDEAGEYLVTFRFETETEPVEIMAESLMVKEAGFIRKAFRAVITQPLFNLLVFFLHYLPSHQLGWAIIMMTLVVRIILFPWNQTAMRSQRKLQKMQPQMEELRKKYGKNQQMLAIKTMEMYKKNKINPMSSCWPMLLQMPFLIGIYLVVKDGLSPHLDHLFYPFFSDFDLDLVDTQFFGLDLEIPNILVLPILVGVAQFIAIKLSMIAAKKNNDKQPTNKKKSKSKAVDSAQPEGMQAQMESMQKMMLWMLPVMIAVFTATFPAAVGIYWLTSTVFGIGQQKLVNWQLDRPQVKRKN